jgi:cytochrome b561
MYKDTKETYGSVAKFFHWMVFILVFCLILVGYFMEDVGKAIQPTVYNLHKLTGLTVLLLMLCRLFWRSINRKPELEGARAWERFLERSMHILLYLVLIAMPLSGWLMSVAAGRAPHLFNLMLTLPITASKPLAELCESIHGTLAIVIIVLVSLHVLAALYHHFVKKDNVLTRMMP